MYEQILVPLDGSAPSESALGAAVVLAQHFGSRLILLHLVERDAPSEVHHERHLQSEADARKYLSEVAHRLPASINADMHVHTEIVSHVGAAIALHAVEEYHPDLIVMATHGADNLQGLVFGSIAEAVVNRSTVPLLLINPEEPLSQIHRILLPLDPDSIHDDGKDAAEALAAKLGARVDLLSVIPTLGTLAGADAATGSMLPTSTKVFLEMREKQVSLHLQEHTSELIGKGVEAGASIARGDPAAEIVSAAITLKSDLIVLATHRRAGTQAFWNRSVAPRVARTGRTALLLIPLN